MGRFTALVGPDWIGGLTQTRRWEMFMRTHILDSAFVKKFDSKILAPKERNLYS
jgi:hypothetical protein